MTTARKPVQLTTRKGETITGVLFEETCIRRKDFRSGKLTRRASNNPTGSSAISKG